MKNGEGQQGDLVTCSYMGAVRLSTYVDYIGTGVSVLCALARRMAVAKVCHVRSMA